MSFDGSDDHIDTTDYALYSMATTGSLSFWINPATAHNNDIIIDNTDASSGNNGFMVRFEDPTGNQAKMKFAIWGPTDSWVLTDEIFTENEWQHVAIVYDGSTGKIYRNGVESVTSSSSSGAMTQNTNTPTYQTRIGEASNDNDNPYHGLMDEVYHFANKALTQAEVTAIYNAGLANTQLSSSIVTVTGEGTYLIDKSGVHNAVIPGGAGASGGGCDSSLYYCGNAQTHGDGFTFGETTAKLGTSWKLDATNNGNLGDAGTAAIALDDGVFPTADSFTLAFWTYIESGGGSGNSGLSPIWSQHDYAQMMYHGTNYS